MQSNGTAHLKFEQSEYARQRAIIHRSKKNHRKHT